MLRAVTVIREGACAPTVVAPICAFGFAVRTHEHASCWVAGFPERTIEPA
jgi:hypothetical protein